MKLFFILSAVLVLEAKIDNGENELQLDTSVLEKINRCYVDSDLRDRARSYPMTLDYFLNIVDKIQRHPRMKAWKADEMSVAILNRFQVNGVFDKISHGGESGQVTFKTEEYAKSNIVKKFLVPAVATYEEEALTPEEECALHYMVSWSLNFTSTLQTAEDYPRSSGQVYTGVFGNVALGPVLQGIASTPTLATVGQVVDELQGTELLFSDWGTVKNGSVLKGTYAATIASELGQTAVWSLSDDKPYSQPYVGPKGYWNNTYCPNDYSLAERSTEAVTMATAAEIVGAIDGLVIANWIESAPAELKKLATLAQVIRMYYGKGLNQVSYNACERKGLYDELESQLSQQTLNFAYTYASVSGRIERAGELDKIVEATLSAFRRDYLSDGFLDCDESNSIYFNGKVQKNELKTDVLFVLDVNDTNSEEGFWDQKEFVMNVMRELDTVINGSRYGLYLNGELTQEVFPLDRHFPSARRRCDILQTRIAPSRTDMPVTIRRMKEIIGSLKELQRSTKMPLAAGKVIVFVYLESTFKDEKAVKNEVELMKLEHPDVTILAVGKYLEPLKTLVRDATNDQFHHIGEPMVYHVPNLLLRLAKVPMTVEYSDCRDEDLELEKNSVGVEYIYDTTNQWFAVPHIYMNASTNMELTIRTDYGKAKICTTRKSPETKPTFDGDDCQDVPSESFATLGPLQPCLDYPIGGCPNYFFQVQGKMKSEDSYCDDVACDSLHQIKLSITHQGVRCAGSVSGATVGVIIASLVVRAIALWSSA